MIYKVQSKAMDWLQYDRDFRNGRVIQCPTLPSKIMMIIIIIIIIIIQSENLTSVTSSGRYCLLLSNEITVSL